MAGRGGWRRARGVCPARGFCTPRAPETQGLNLEEANSHQISLKVSPRQLSNVVESGSGAGSSSSLSKGVMVKSGEEGEGSEVTESREEEKDVGGRNCGSTREGGIGLNC